MVRVRSWWYLVSQSLRRRVSDPAAVRHTHQLCTQLQHVSQRQVANVGVLLTGETGDAGLLTVHDEKRLHIQSKPSTARKDGMSFCLKNRGTSPKACILLFGQQGPPKMVAKDSCLALNTERGPNSCRYKLVQVFFLLVKIIYAVVAVVLQSATPL